MTDKIKEENAIMKQNTEKRALEYLKYEKHKINYNAIEILREDALKEGFNEQVYINEFIYQLEKKAKQRYS